MALLNLDRLRVYQSKTLKSYERLSLINPICNSLLGLLPNMGFNYQHSPSRATSPARLTHAKDSKIITDLGHIGSATILDKLSLGQSKIVKPYGRLFSSNPVFNCLSRFLSDVRFNHHHAQPSLHFEVLRREPELIKPAHPTPFESKHLSDIDDQETLRSQVPVIQFYRSNPLMKGKDPVKVIRDALAKALVSYYPFAGRLVEGHDGKLIVECNGEGILFIEADADVSLDQFGDALQPPIPCFEELLLDVPGSKGILNCPLLLIQVTRLRCGSFIFAIRLNHTMSGATGLVQFLTAVGEIARGAQAPSILPVWERHVLDASNPPCVTFTHREYEHVEDTKRTTVLPPDDMSHNSFFFGPKEISSLRQLVPENLRNCTTFELITTCLWKCRTIALQLDPTEEIRMIFLVNASKKFNPPLPKGYYGNITASPVAVATAGELTQHPFGYGLELIQKAKAEVSEKYMRSMASLIVMRGRPPFTLVGAFVVTDIRWAGFNEVDYGWGKAVSSGIGKTSELMSCYVPFTNKKGENGTVAPLSLPRLAMDRFVKELDNMLTMLTM